MAINKVLGITVQNVTKKEILEQCKKYIDTGKSFVHIVSLNPENLVVSHENKEFRKVVSSAQIRILDGIGVVLAARLLGIEAGERVTGVDLMINLMEEAGKRRFGVLLLGGSPFLAKNIAECYQKKYPEASFFGIEAFKKIQNPTEEEERNVFSIVRTRKPCLIFAAFGSPAQELWLYRHRMQLKGAVCMGVGGAFDYVSGSLKRADPFIRRLGLEWLYRLIKQPWRWKRQLRLVKFISLVFTERIHLFFISR